MIPYNIFQIGPLYDEKYNVFKVMNPEYKYHFYDDMECLSMLEKYGLHEEKHAFQIALSGAMKADICRTAILKYIGGVYIETDIELLKPLHSIHQNLHNFSLFTGYHWPFEFIGAVAHHPIIVQALNTQVNNVLFYSSKLKAGEFPCRSAHQCVVRVTGPFAYWSSIGDVTHKSECKNKRIKNRLPKPRDCLHSSNHYLQNMYICPMNSSNLYRTYSCSIALHSDCRNSLKRRNCGKKHYSKNKIFFNLNV